MRQQIYGREAGKTGAFLVFLMGAFLCYSLYVGLFGTLSTTMMEYYQINTGAQWVFTMAGSIGGIAAAVFCALAGERFHKLWAVLIGLLILGIATCLVGTAPPYLALCVFALLCGVGYTVVDVMGNSAVTEYFLSKSNLLLPMVQIVFGVGTMIGPILITSMLVPGNPQSFTNSFLLIGGVCLAMACGYVVSLKTALPFLPKIDLKKMADSARQNPAEIFRSWKSWMILASCSMFTCFFTSAIAWYPTFFAQERGMNTEEAALMLTLFYVGMLVMRVISPFLLRKIRPQRIYVLFNIFSISCMLIAMNTPSVSMAAVFTVIGGAFLSLNVICVIMIATMLFPTRKASASSLAVFSYNIGGMVAPALVGAMAESMGLQTPLNIMCAVFAAGVVLMAVLSCKCKKELQEF